MRKFTKKDFAKEMDSYLMKHKGVFVKTDDILECMISKGMFAEIIKEKRWTNATDIDVVRSEFENIIKKAKSDLRSGLRAYNYDFEIEGGLYNGQRFRYPENIDFSPYQAYLRREKVDVQSIDYKYSKRVEGRIKQCMDEKYVVEFDMVPSFDRSSAFCHVILHPHYIKSYNGRKFVFGFSVVNYYDKAQGCETKVFESGVFPFDRVISESVNVLKQEAYNPSNINYNTFFDDVIGVTHYEDEKGVLYPLELITIKTLTPYAHGRIITRPLHHSQQEQREFADGYGLITLNVRYNKEFLGALFGFESGVEVLSPQYIRDFFKAEASQMYKLYATETKE